MRPRKCSMRALVSPAAATPRLRACTGCACNSSFPSTSSSSPLSSCQGVCASAAADGAAGDARGIVHARSNALPAIVAALRALQVVRVRAVNGVRKRHDEAEGEEEERDENGAEKSSVRVLLAVSLGISIYLLTRRRARRRRQRARLREIVPSSEGDMDTEIKASNALLLEYSDLRARPRRIVIVTTAALPWMTGTAVNPVLRAVHLAKDGHSVQLVVPWLQSDADQRKVYSRTNVFVNKDEQAEVIGEWIREQSDDVQIGIRFYEGVYSDDFGSILPLGDITAMFAHENSDCLDVCILEEPEHLTWHHTGARWTRLFNFCVGVVHTNYIEYTRKYGIFGPQRAVLLQLLNKWVCRSYCHRVIKLSDAVQTLPHSVTCNVHGVRQKFLDIGRVRRELNQSFEKDAYFLGKVLWTKGYARLIELLRLHHERTGRRLPIDFFGAGPDLEEVKTAVKEDFALSKVQVHGLVVDHASPFLQRYKVYVNASVSDVVCTATAEALAMGKFVVLRKHPSNEFFGSFANCMLYETPEQFSVMFAKALAETPVEMSEDELYRLSWKAATERFYDAAKLPVDAKRLSAVDNALARTHTAICGALTPPADNAVRRKLRERMKALRERENQEQRKRAPVLHGLPPFEGT